MHIAGKGTTTLMGYQILLVKLTKVFILNLIILSLFHLRRISSFAFLSSHSPHYTSSSHTNSVLRTSPAVVVLRRLRRICCSVRVSSLLRRFCSGSSKLPSMRAAESWRERLPSRSSRRMKCSRRLRREAPRSRKHGEGLWRIERCYGCFLR